MEVWKKVPGSLEAVRHDTAERAQTCLATTRFFMQSHFFHISLGT